jgi:uncharacterized protein (TIGR02246 family)
MPLSFADKAEIIELHARYNRSIDTGDAEAWAACFTPDGAFDAPSRPSQGTDELIEFVRIYHERPASQGAVHWNSHPIVDGDGDVATAHVDFVVVRADHDGGAIVSTGTYASTLRKLHGRWLFARRVPVVTSPTPS